MKFYTLDFDCNVPTTQQVNVPTNTDYRIGVKVTRNGKKVDLQPGDVTLGGQAADSGLTNGYVTFTKATGDSASMGVRALSIAYNPPVVSAALNTSFKLIENVYKSQQGDIDLVGDTSGFYTKGETDAMLSAKADESELTAYAGKSELSAYAGKSDVLTKEQLSAMLAPVKNTSTGYVKDLSAVTSADVVSCLYNIGAELFGVPPPPVYGLPPSAFPVEVVVPDVGRATFRSNDELDIMDGPGGSHLMYGSFPDVGLWQFCTFDSSGVFQSTTASTLSFNGLDPIPGERPVLGWH